LEVSGDAMLPLYRDGDLLVVSPTANIRRGDRVVVRSRAGDILARELKRRTAKSLELGPLGRNGEDQTMPTDEVEWLARVMWARQ
jgi:phage repressor protein C with HTH and peptisase S24 domain